MATLLACRMAHVHACVLRGNRLRKRLRTARWCQPAVHAVYATTKCLRVRQGRSVSHSATTSGEPYQSLPLALLCQQAGMTSVSAPGTTAEHSGVTPSPSTDASPQLACMAARVSEQCKSSASRQSAQRQLQQTHALPGSAHHSKTRQLLLNERRAPRTRSAQTRHLRRP